MDFILEKLTFSQNGVYFLHFLHVPQFTIRWSDVDGLHSEMHTQTKWMLSKTKNQKTKNKNQTLSIRKQKMCADLSGGNSDRRDGCTTAHMFGDRWKLNGHTLNIEPNRMFGKIQIYCSNLFPCQTSNEQCSARSKSDIFIFDFEAIKLNWSATPCVEPRAHTHTHRTPHTVYSLTVNLSSKISWNIWNETKRNENGKQHLNIW